MPFAIVGIPDCWGFHHRTRSLAFSMAREYISGISCMRANLIEFEDIEGLFYIPLLA